MSKQYIQVPGVVFGPEPELPKFRINWGTPYQRTKKKSWVRQARRARLARKKVLKEERLVRREQMRLLLDWLLEWPCEDLPAGPQKAEKKTKRTTHHGTEEVTSQVGTNLKMSIENL